MAAKKTVKKLGREYFKAVSLMLTSAFGLTAALAWNELVKAIISRYFSQGEGIKSNLVYALAVTILAVLVTTYLAGWAKRLGKEETVDEN